MKSAPVVRGKKGKIMPFQVGSAGPIVYNQDNSGTENDISTNLEYTPEQFGAPAGSKILVGSLSQSTHVDRGWAEIRGYSAQPEAVRFTVWTQAAGGGLFGHHSGAISVSTSFVWYHE